MAAFVKLLMLTQEPSSGDKSNGPKRRKRQGDCQALDCSRNTVRRYLRDQAAQRYGPRELRASKLDDYKRYLQKRINQARQRWIPATVLLREIQERGYAGGISQLKAWLAPLKKHEPESWCVSRRRRANRCRQTLPMFAEDVTP
jgi:hypothetical protein